MTSHQLIGITGAAANLPAQVLSTAQVQARATGGADRGSGELASDPR
jgi:hypothetical protein